MPAFYALAKHAALHDLVSSRIGEPSSRSSTASPLGDGSLASILVQPRLAGTVSPGLTCFVLNYMEEGCVFFFSRLLFWSSFFRLVCCSSFHQQSICLCYRSLIAEGAGSVWGCSAKPNTAASGNVSCFFLLFVAPASQGGSVRFSVPTAVYGGGFFTHQARARRRLG